MRQAILNRAIKLADKSKVRSANVVVAHPKQIKAEAEILSQRLYTRIKPSEHRRLMKIIWDMFPVSALLRDLVVTYITNKETEHGRTRKKK